MRDAAVGRDPKPALRIDVKSFNKANGQSVGGTESDEGFAVIAGEAGERAINRVSAGEPHLAVGILRNGTDRVVLQAVGGGECSEHRRWIVLGCCFTAFCPAVHARHASAITPEPHRSVRRFENRLHASPGQSVGLREALRCLQVCRSCGKQRHSVIRPDPKAAVGCSAEQTHRLGEKRDLAFSHGGFIEVPPGQQVRLAGCRRGGHGRLDLLHRERLFPDAHVVDRAVPITRSQSGKGIVTDEQRTGHRHHSMLHRVCRRCQSVAGIEVERRLGRRHDQRHEEPTADGRGETGLPIIRLRGIQPSVTKVGAGVIDMETKGILPDTWCRGTSAQDVRRISLGRVTLDPGRDGHGIAVERERRHFRVAGRPIKLQHAFLDQRDRFRCWTLGFDDLRLAHEHSIVAIRRQVAGGAILEIPQRSQSRLTSGQLFREVLADFLRGARNFPHPHLVHLALKRSVVMVALRHGLAEAVQRAVL